MASNQAYPAIHGPCGVEGMYVELSRLLLVNINFDEQMFEGVEGILLQ